MVLRLLFSGCVWAVLSFMHGAKNSGVSVGLFNTNKVLNPLLSEISNFFRIL